jgi:methyl-accepting chemotaxis protein
MLKGTITEKGFKRRLVLIILGIFLFFSLISALVLYRSLHVPLSPHYGATVSILTQAKESLVIRTIEVNFIFYFLIAIGVALLGILYSHRIAGPLVRVKQYAAMLGEGRFDERISFREKDAIHKLAIELNEMAKECEGRTKLLASQLRELEDGLKLLSSLPDESEEKAELIKRLLELDAKIREGHKKIII